MNSLLRPVRLLVFPSLALLAVAAPAQERHVIAYFPSWKWNASSGMTTVKQIPFSKVTDVNYAFFFPRPDGSLCGRDTSGDAVYLGGGPGGAESLVEAAHRQNVRVFLSIGGWDDSGNFPEVASSPATRSRFASACAKQIRQHGFDGIDIDWEFPCYAEHRGTPADKQNCTALFQALRDTLDQLGRMDGRRYQLSAALPAGPVFTASFEMEKISVLLDMLNIMTYDFNGPWDPLSGHNAPLFAGPGADSTRSVDAAFRMYTGQFHVNPAKLNLGVPFYGHAYAACKGPGEPHGGEEHLHFSSQGAFYADIVRLSGQFEKKWDEAAKVPYLIQPAWNVFVSYDDSQSVSLKAKYAAEHGACGLVIWELTGDFLPSGATPLLDAIVAEFRNQR